MSHVSTKVGFIGAGRMATALANGLVNAGFARKDEIFASDVSPAAKESFSQATGLQTVAGNRDVLQRSEVVVLAVKPQMMNAVLEEIAEAVTEQHLLISIAAGVSLATMESRLGGAHRIVRTMPNTPCLVGAGASGFALGRSATSSDAELVARMLSTVGIAVQVPEPLLDPVTGLSGSGPAYVFEIIEALSDGGVLMGLPRETATVLAAQTLLGAARMVLETGEHPGRLKDAVTSPGGTTIAGLHELERAGLRGTLMNAVRAATERSQELGRPAG